MYKSFNIAEALTLYVEIKMGRKPVLTLEQIRENNRLRQKRWRDNHKVKEQ